MYIILTASYEDYPIADVLQMIGQANLPGREQEGKAVILCQTSKKAYYRKFLEDPLAVSFYFYYWTQCSIIKHCVLLSDTVF